MCFIYILNLAKECDDSSDHSTPEKYTYIVNREDSEEEDAQSEEAENGEVGLTVWLWPT